MHSSLLPAMSAVQEAGAACRHFDRQITDQIDRIGQHPFIIVRALDPHDVAAHFVVCQTQNDTAEFIRKLGALPCFARSKLLRAVVRALQLDIYEAADLLFSWTTSPAAAPCESPLIGLPDGELKPWFYGYPAYEIGGTKSAANAPEQQIAALISIFDAYEATDGNNRLNSPSSRRSRSGFVGPWVAMAGSRKPVSLPIVH